MPKIGCGLDKLEWPRVREMISSTFQDMNFKVTVYSLGIKTIVKANIVRQ
jgi:hypothetical protein